MFLIADLFLLNDFVQNCLDKSQTFCIYKLTLHLRVITHWQRQMQKNVHEVHARGLM